MNEESKRHFAWKIPLAGAVAGLVALLPCMIFHNDLAALLATIGLSFCLGFILLLVATMNVKRQAISALLMLASFCVVSWLLFKSRTTSMRQEDGSYTAANTKQKSFDKIREMAS